MSLKPPRKIEKKAEERNLIDGALLQERKKTKNNMKNKRRKFIYKQIEKKNKHLCKNRQICIKQVSPDDYDDDGDDGDDDALLCARVV